MKITIDTKEDSKEEIQKVIQLLSGLVGGSGFRSVGAKEIKSDGDLFSSDSESSGNAFASMFGSSEVEKKEEAPNDFSMDLISDFKEEEKEDDEEEVPGVVSY